MGDDYGFQPSTRRRSEKRKSPPEELSSGMKRKLPNQRQTRSPPAPQRFQIQTNNRFDATSEDDEQESDNESVDMDVKEEPMPSTSEEEQRLRPQGGRAGQTPPKIKKPTPIIIRGRITQCDGFSRAIKELAPKGHFFRFTSQNTQIHTENEEEKKKVLEHLTAKNIDCHSYTNKDTKTHAFLLKGLATKPTPEQLKEELGDRYHLKPLNIFALKNVTTPMYLVITDNSVTLNQLTRQVKILSFTAVHWERQINNKKMVQCHRCQMWGHATSNCYSTIRCMKCAGRHWTYECTKDPNTPAKCVNCDGPHPANSTDCEVYQDRLRFLEEKKANQQPSTTRRNQPPPAPDTTNRTEFPEIGRRRPSPTNAWQNGRDNVSTNITTPTNQTETDTKQALLTTVDFSITLTSLRNEIGELNELINLEAALTAVRDLNALLRKCNGDRTQKFLTLQQFMTNINQHDI